MIDELPRAVDQRREPRVDRANGGRQAADERGDASGHRTGIQVVGSRRGTDRELIARNADAGVPVENLAR
ncbi:MAG TPA: hypothetical protein VNG89_21165, partial [Vicinamibacterales bacterium]|nr:hypothetical protein [Vicinamibacterales bacterium]